MVRGVPKIGMINEICCAYLTDAWLKLIRSKLCNFLKWLFYLLGFIFFPTLFKLGVVMSEVMFISLWCTYGMGHGYFAAWFYHIWAAFVTFVIFFHKIRQGWGYFYTCRKTTAKRYICRRDWLVPPNTKFDWPWIISSHKISVYDSLGWICFPARCTYCGNCSYQSSWGCRSSNSSSPFSLVSCFPTGALGSAGNRFTLTFWYIQFFFSLYYCECSVLFLQDSNCMFFVLFFQLTLFSFRFCRVS